MQYNSMTPTYSQLATASGNMDIVRSHELATEKLLDFFEMFEHQKKAVLAAKSAHQAGMEEYLSNSDADKLKVCNDHYSHLLNNFKIFTDDIQVTMDDYAAAKYQYQSVFPLGHPDGWSPLEEANQTLVAEAQAPHETLILTGVSADSSDPAAPVI